jgi:hypothetical protein
MPLSDLHRYYRTWAQRQHIDPFGIESFRQRLSELGVQVVDQDHKEIVVDLNIVKPENLTMDDMDQMVA